MNELTLHERIGKMIDLRRQFPDITEIPSESLSSIGYVMLSEDGTNQLMPIEKYEQLQSGESPETLSTPPFDKIEFDSATSSSFKVGVSVRDIHDGVDAILKPFAQERPIFEIGNSRESAKYEFHDFIERYPGDKAALHAFLKSIPERLNILTPTNSYYWESLHDDYDAVDYFMPIVNSVFTQKHSGEIDISGWDLLGDEAYYLQEHTTLEQNEEIWTALERLKSRICDIPELEKFFWESYERYGKTDEFYTTDNPNPSIHLGQDFESALLEPELLERGLLEPGETLSVKIPETDPNKFGIKIKLALISEACRANGLTGLASALLTAGSLAEAQALVAEAIENKVPAQKFVEEEKQLRKLRSEMVEQEDIMEHQRQLSALKKDKKHSMLFLRGVHEYFSFAERFATYASNRIEKVQNMLKAGGDSGTDKIVLDARYDEELDTNPGKISGDCTDGKPLHFSEASVASNVKIFKNGSHVGNIYLVKSSKVSLAPGWREGVSQDKSVWHLDAIQFPSYTTDQEDFIRNLMDNLQEEARIKGVDYITINSKPAHMSNYDYVSRAILKVYGHPSPEVIKYGQMDQDGGEDEQVLPGKKNVKVEIKKQPGYSDFQGVDDDQIVLWENPDN